jgi:hypothetical protein
MIFCWGRFSKNVKDSSFKKTGETQTGHDKLQEGPNLDNTKNLASVDKDRNAKTSLEMTIPVAGGGSRYRK